MIIRIYFFSDIQEGKPWRMDYRVCGLAWPILGRLGRLDSSSNLDRPTTNRLDGNVDFVNEDEENLIDESE